MNRGCVIGLFLTLIAVGIGGYIAYRFAVSVSDVPADLAAYQYHDSVRAMVRSRAAAPADTAHLASQHLPTLLAAVDSSDAILTNFLTSMDSLGSGSGGVIKEVGKGMEIVRQIRLIPASLRRGVVAALNQQNRSWDEYLWIKERAVAAAGITKADVDSAMRALLREKFTDSTIVNINDLEEELADFYRRTDSLRLSGAIDTAEAALMRQHRETLLERGKLLLLGIEVSDEAEVMLEK